MTGKPPAALSIAGFDPSNGAGITADLQVFAAHGLFGMSAITALTVQSTLGVKSVHPIPAEVLEATLEHLAEDIVPDGIKIGMLATFATVVGVTRFLQNFRQRVSPQTVPVVLDPVLRSSSGSALLDPEGLSELQNRLLACASWITPNWAELELLSGCNVQSLAAAMDATKILGDRHPHLHIVVTGGDVEGEPIDLWRSSSGKFEILHGERIQTTSTHGTGCAFSSALLSHLVLGASAEQAVSRAKTYVEGALRYAPGLGNGRGPLNLLWPNGAFRMSQST